MSTEYDVITVGAGPGGYVAAIRAAQLGLKTAIIEKNQTLGGTCLNIGCIPSKALLDSSEFYARITHESQEHGIAYEALSLDLAQMMQRKERIVGKLTRGVGGLMKKNGVEVWTGLGTVRKAHEVVVKDAEGKETTLSAKDIILATGSVSQNLPFLPIDGETIVTSTEALSFQDVPKSLIVIGAGAIGLELGSVWSRLGANVTVVELLPNILLVFRLIC